MPYSEADFERMEHDPVLRKQYAWQCAQRSILHAAQLWREGEFEMARVCDRFGRLLLDNLDAFAGPIETEEGK